MRKKSYSQAIAEAQWQEMQTDTTVFLMGLVLRDPYGAAFGQTKGVSSKVGTQRVIDVPVSEAAYTGAAIGAAITGMRPVIEYQFSDFITIAMDQVVQQAANMRYMFGGVMKVPMVMRGPCGAYIRAAAHHSHMLESWFAHIPGLKVVLPSDAYDAKGLLISAIRDDNPVLYFEHKKLYDKKCDVPEEPYTIPLGKASIKREGRDVTIVSYSYTLHLALTAAAEIKKNGVHAEVIDLRTVAPLDEETILNSLKKTGPLVVVQESYARCSVSSEISAIVADKGFHFLKAPIKRVHCKEAPMPFAPILEDTVLPNVSDIYEAIQSVMA